MGKITLTIDDYLVPQNDRREVIEIIKKIGIENEIWECDTHSMGGVSWFPTDFIIAIAGLTAAGFLSALGEDAYNQLKNKIKKILSSNKAMNEMIYYLYISFEIKDITLYFEVNVTTVSIIDIALEKMISDFDMITEEVARLIQFNPEKITGKFSSVTFIFDDEENKWIISHFNKH